MLREPDVWKRGPLVIPRNDENRNAAVRDGYQRIESLVSKRCRHTRTIEYVAAMDNDIHFCAECRLERSMVVAQKIVTAAPAFHAGLSGQIEAEVRVCEEQDADFRHWEKLHISAFIR
jgi:hypothetical protein